MVVICHNSASKKPSQTTPKLRASVWNWRVQLQFRIFDNRLASHHFSLFFCFRAMPTHRVSSLILTKIKPGNMSMVIDHANAVRIECGVCWPSNSVENWLNVNITIMSTTACFAIVTHCMIAQRVRERFHDAASSIDRWPLVVVIECVRKQMRRRRAKRIFIDCEQQFGQIIQNICSAKIRQRLQEIDERRAKKTPPTTTAERKRETRNTWTSDCKHRTQDTRHKTQTNWQGETIVPHYIHCSDLLIKKSENKCVIESLCKKHFLIQMNHFGV